MLFLSDPVRVCLLVIDEQVQLAAVIDGTVNVVMTGTVVVKVVEAFFACQCIRAHVSGDDRHIKAAGGRGILP